MPPGPPRPSVRSRPSFTLVYTSRQLPSHVFASHHLWACFALPCSCLEPSALGVRPLCSFNPAKTRDTGRPLQILTDSQPAVSGFGRSMPPGTLLTLRSLRHLPPSLHSASVTPAPILFTICTQKPGQPQTMYLICTHAICTRAHKTHPHQIQAA